MPIFMGQSGISFLTIGKQYGRLGHFMKKIIFVGAGHANLEVIKSLSTQHGRDATYTLISPEKNTFYSGLLPRFILGELQSKDLAIDLERLCKLNKITFVQAMVLKIDPDKKILLASDGTTFEFDYLFLNVGGVPTKLSTDPESEVRSVYVKPITSFVEKWREVQRECSSCRELLFAVVGGGAASIEVATALNLRLKKNGANRSRVHLFTRDMALAKNYESKVSLSLLRSLQQAGVEVHFDHDVVETKDRHLIFQGEKSAFRYDFLFPILPMKSPPSIDISNIQRDSSGFVVVDSFLRAHSNVFAAGDCTTFEPSKFLPRSGVTAVQQGRLMAFNLRHGLGAISDLKPYVPPKAQLNILLSGPSSAHAIFGKHFIAGKMALLLKNYIDNSYMKSFNLEKDIK